MRRSEIQNHITETPATADRPHTLSAQVIQTASPPTFVRLRYRLMICTLGLCIMIGFALKMQNQVRNYGWSAHFQPMSHYHGEYPPVGRLIDAFPLFNVVFICAGARVIWSGWRLRRD